MLHTNPILSCKTSLLIFLFILRLSQPQHTLPDVFVCLVSNNKRLAYARIPARHLLFSESPEQRGRDCGKIKTLFLKVWYQMLSSGFNFKLLKGKIHYILIKMCFSLQGSVHRVGPSRLNLMCTYGWELAEIHPTCWTISHLDLNWKASHLRTGLALLLNVYSTQVRLLIILCC